MRTITSWLFVLVAALAAVPHVPAQVGPGGGLTLEQAIATALEQSHLLAAAGAREGVARATLTEAESYRLPRLELSEAYSRTTNPVMVFMNLLGQEQFGPANFDPNFLNRPPAFSNFNSKVSISQPIYTGGKIKSGVAAARYGFSAAESDRTRERQKVIHQVVEAYSGAVLAAAHQKVAQEALETAKAHVKLVEDLRAAGLVVDSDRLQAKVREGEMEEMVIRARAAVAVALAGLNMVMGRDLDTPVELPGEIALPDLRGDALDELTGEAVRSRRDIQAMESRVAAAGKMVSFARAGYLPEVGLTAAYEWNKETAPGSQGKNWSVFVGARFTPFDGFGTRARVAKAKEEAKWAGEMLTLMRDGIGLEVRQAWYELEAARQRLTIAASAVEQARAALKIVEDRYREGMTTLVELMGAQTAVTAARTREVSARRDVLLGKATLDLAAGRL